MTNPQKKISREFASVFGRAPDFVTRAPGRVEFIGNHTDYNGGTVLGAAIDRTVTVAVAARSDGRRRFCSQLTGKVVSLAGGKPQKQTGAKGWLNYPLGVISALPKFGLRAPEGFDFYVTSDLPLGAGLSSSAALELSSALAFLALTGESAPRETVVKVGRHAENHFVGVPCGILDQGVSGFGQKDRLVWIDCRGPKFATVPMPGEAQFWIFNTHTKHALVDGFYAARHKACMAAAKSLGVPLLADATLKQLETAQAKLKPEAYKRARHVIEEIARVAASVKALKRRDLAAVGKLLTASHRSSQTLFENSTPELDFLVDTLVAMPEVFGARLTGGGFGGAVMALTSKKFGPAHARRVVAAYRRKFGASPDVLHTQTGDGAERLA
ncbi:MAG TPA: galactokinase [Opitutus sp.]|nr:galactokinase [Opitutus sp.]